jgi:hypothetical protein
MSDNDDATTLLGNSEELSVQNPVGEPIPEFPQAPEDGTEIPPLITTEQARHILADEPAWPCLSQDSHDVPPQPCSCSSQARTASRHGHVLTGPPCGDDSPVGNKSSCSEVIAAHFGHVGELVGIGEMAVGDGGCGRVDFDCRDGAHTGTGERQREPADTVEQGYQH